MSNETKEMVLEACTEFVQCVASEANEISTKENKTTILPEHVVRALESLDFHGYVGAVSDAWNEMKTEGKEARAEKKKKKGMQMTPEEALAMQQRMFAEARARYNSGDASGCVGVGSLASGPEVRPMAAPVGGPMDGPPRPPPGLNGGATGVGGAPPPQAQAVAPVAAVGRDAVGGAQALAAGVGGSLVPGAPPAASAQEAPAPASYVGSLGSLD